MVKFIVIVIVSILYLYSVIKAQVKKNKESKRATLEHEVDNPRPRIKHSHPAASVTLDWEKTPEAIIESTPTPASTPLQRQQSTFKPVAMPKPARPLVVNVPIAAQAAILPQEGERVTPAVAKKDNAPVITASGLHNRDNLRRAIIFGEILAPKF